MTDSPRFGAPKPMDGSSDPGPESDDAADDFLRELAQVEEVPVPESEPPIGPVFGRFRILGELGRGGMGIVYLAYDESLRRSLALKLLRPGLSRQDERRNRFLREARAAAAVTHPHLTTIYDVGEVEGRAFIAMERLDGESLRRIIARGPLPIAEAVRVASQILAGLGQAHSAGFVHRDLKPDNVIVTANGIVKLLDFGLAKRHLGTASANDHDPAIEETGQRDTAAGQLLGTPAYMSPEQVRGAPVDPRSDIFSFGVLLFEMLAGVRPFEARSAAELQSAILRDAPRRLGALRERVPRAVESVVERCLQKDPEQRYSSCSAIANDLARALGPSPPTMAGRRRWGLALAAVVALGVSARLLQSAAPRSGSASGTGSAAPRSGSAAASGAAASGEAASGEAASGAAKAGAPADSAEAVPVTALPLPPSKNAEALAAYAASLQASRDGNWGYVTSLLQRAVALDPTLAVAYLRLGIYHMYGPLDRLGRESFGRALLGRASLSERDRVMLDAFEPNYRDPRNRDEVVSRLRAATARYPNDVEFHSLLAMLSPEAREAVAAAQRSVELDPRGADGWQFLGANLDRLGDTEGGLRALDRCVALSPVAADCHAQRGYLYFKQGRCVEMEQDLRAALVGSRSLLWHDGLAAAMFALGRPPEAILEVYETKWSQLPPEVRAITELMDRSGLALALGRFAEAERMSLEARRRLVGDPDASLHARVALRLVDLYTEMGRPQEAARIGDDYSRRRAGWASSTRGDGPSMHMLWAMLRGNLLSRASFIERRDAWLREMDLASGAPQRLEAAAAYASGVQTEAEAREALLLFPGLERSLAEATYSQRTLLRQLDVLTGRAREAIPDLEVMAHSCGALMSPVEYVRASFYLGRAEDATGNKAGACAAYGSVLARWGSASPPSRTARQARARSVALGCRVTPTLPAAP